MKYCSNDACPDLLRNGFRSEYMDHLETCPKCDQPLTDGAAPAPVPTRSKVIEWVDHVCVATFSDAASAHVALASLESAGIPGVVQDEHMQGFYPQAIAARLCVPPEHAEEAARVLASDHAELVEEAADDLPSTDEESPSDTAKEVQQQIVASPYQTAETLAIFLIACGYPLVVNSMYGDAPAPTASDLAAYSLLDLGWAVLLCCLLTRDRTFRWNLPVTRPQWFAEAGWGVVLFFVCIGANELFEDLARSLGLDAAPSPWEQWLSDPDVLLAFRITGPLSALSQELMFRVYLQTRLTLIARGWSLVSVPITAWLFAWMHDDALAETAELFGWALVLGIAYQVSRRVPRIAIAHALALVFRPV